MNPSMWRTHPQAEPHVAFGDLHRRHPRPEPGREEGPLEINLVTPEVDVR
jgi:hypothetical protein